MAKKKRKVGVRTINGIQYTKIKCIPKKLYSSEKKARDAAKRAAKRMRDEKGVNVRSVKSGDAYCLYVAPKRRGKRKLPSQ